VFAHTCECAHTNAQIEVGLLGEQERAAILRLKMKGTPMSRDTDLAVIARHTPGYSGAVCACVCVCVCVCVRACVCVCVCVTLHTHTHAHDYTRAHTGVGAAMQGGCHVRLA